MLFQPFLIINALRAEILHNLEQNLTVAGLYFLLDFEHDFVGFPPRTRGVITLHHALRVKKRQQCVTIDCPAGKKLKKNYNKNYLASGQKFINNFRPSGRRIFPKILK